MKLFIRNFKFQSHNGINNNVNETLAISNKIEENITKTAKITGFRSVIRGKCQNVRQLNSFVPHATNPTD